MSLPGMLKLIDPQKTLPIMNLNSIESHLTKGKQVHSFVACDPSMARCDGGISGYLEL